MKKTLTINLSGSVFHIDDDAYEKLYAYLTQITRHFGNDAEAKEIVEDIETRIAEIFTEKIKNGGEVINLDHVNEVIVIMGTPEAISNEEEEKQPSSGRKFYQTGGRRLYRDPDDKVLGGVCGGLGAYFAIDPVIIRILFVLIFFLGGSGVLVYLVLWIVVPKAYSTAQRLEMKGEEVNIDNISKSIKEEMQDVKENFRNYRSHPAYAQGRSNVREVGDTLLSVLKILGTIMLVIIGLPFLIVGAVCLIILFALLFASHHIVGLMPFNNGFNFMEHLYTPGATLSWMTVGIALVIGIPLVMLIYAGIKMIFRVKSRNHIFGSIFAGLFVVGIIILIISGSNTLGEFQKQATVTHSEKLTTASDTIYISAKKDQAEKDLDAIIDPDLNFERFRIGTLNDADVVIGIPELRIEKSDDKEMNLLINKISRGTSISSARQNAEEVLFNYQLKDSMINVQSSYLLPKIWRNQRVNLKLYIPEGKTIYLDESVKPILHDVRNTSDTYDDDMVNKYWTMKPDGLTLVNRAIPNVKPVKK
ncbi:MAG: PspC domain-containing protein [Prolixibacteraceae bacterium]|jgi:phage shock protein PspC (stress-responsive transcriptional regulator)|nr:PspC domain-containing protein [Prolixibacteraceae bacterium]